MREDEAQWLEERLLAANRRYLRGRPAIPEDPAPSLRIAVLTCMDVRIDPLPLLGLQLGEAHVLRNAGARVTEDVLRSLVISQQALGTNAVVLMPHTRCGVLGLDAAALQPPRSASFGTPEPLDFHAMEDLRAALSEDLEKLRESPWMPQDVHLLGLILDIDSGALAALRKPAREN